MSRTFYASIWPPAAAWPRLSQRRLPAAETAKASAYPPRQSQTFLSHFLRGAAHGPARAGQLPFPSRDQPVYWVSDQAGCIRQRAVLRRFFHPAKILGEAADDSVRQLAVFVSNYSSSHAPFGVRRGVVVPTWSPQCMESRGLSLLGGYMPIAAFLVPETEERGGGEGGRRFDALPY